MKKIIKTTTGTATCRGWTDQKSTKKQRHKWLEKEAKKFANLFREVLKRMSKE